MAHPWVPQHNKYPPGAFRAVEKISPPISLFFRKMIAQVLKFSCAKRFED